MCGQVDKGESILDFYQKLAERYPDEAMFAELALSALSGREEDFLKKLENTSSSDISLWKSLCQEIISNKAMEKRNAEMFPAQNNPYGDHRQKGLELYRIYCSACHGEDGHGIENLAPPLYDSEYVSGPVERLGLIILHGLHGPIHIGGKRYDFNAPMPGIGINPDLNDEDIKSIMAFVINAYSTEWPELDVNMIKRLRTQTPPEGTMYTETLLNNIEYNQ